MKIGVVCPDDFSIVQFCGALVRLLQNGGENVVYAVCDVKSEGPAGYYTDIMKSWGVRHLPVKYYQFLSIRRDAAYFTSLYSVLKREQFDLVVTIATKPNVYGAIAARLAGTKRIICSVWGLGITFGDRRGVKAWLVRSIVLGLYWLGFRAATKVWFTNQADYDLLRSKHVVDPRKAFVTRNYVNTTTYAPTSVSERQLTDLRHEFGLAETDRVVVMVARMNWAKGVREFAEAAAILRADAPMIKFILVGPTEAGSLEGVPEAYLRDNSRYENFVWTGFRNDVQAFYGISAVTVLPSYYREGGFPRGLTEAMCMGKPIITTDSVHCRATVENGKNGYHVPIKDSAALAKAIKDIIMDDERLAQFGRYSRAKAIREFDEDVVMVDVVRLMLEN